MKSVVMIESPYSGDIDRNIRYLLLCVAETGTVYDEVPYASHLYMTQHPRCRDFYTCDYDEKWTVLTRDIAIENSQSFRHRCDKSIFYTDLGWSRGMESAKKYCIEHNLLFEERRINIERLSQSVPYLTTDFIEAILNKDEQYVSFLE